MDDRPSIRFEDWWPLATLSDFYDRLLANPPGQLLVDGATVYVGISAVYEAAKIAGDMGFLILGVDGVQTNGAHVFLMIDYIADLSGSNDDRPWSEKASATVEFFKDIPQEWLGGPQFVEFVLLGEDEARPSWP